MKPFDDVALHRYIHDLCERMGLRDWDVSIIESEPDPEHDAECHTIYGAKRARLRISESLREYSPEKQRRIIVHELVHPHLDNLYESFKTLQGHLHRDAYDLLEQAVRRDLEFAVDGISVAWAESLPLPPDPGTPDAPSPANGGGDDALQVNQTSPLFIRQTPEDRETVGEGSGRQSQDQTQIEESVATRARARMAALERPLS